VFAQHQYPAFGTGLHLFYPMFLPFEPIGIGDDTGIIDVKLHFFTFLLINNPIKNKTDTNAAIFPR
jgi:hypothetical protein